MNPMSSGEQSAHPLTGYVLRLSAMLCIAIMLAAVKYASELNAHLVEILFIRSLIALPLMVVWAFASRGGVRTLRPNSWRNQGLRAVIGLTGMAFTFSAISLLPIAEAMVIIFSSPLFAAILAALILSERLRPIQVAAIIVGLIGVLVVARPGGKELSVLGVFLGVCAAITSGLVVVTLRQIVKSESTLATTFWFNCASILVFGALFPFYAQQQSLLVWVAIFISAAMGSLGQVLHMYSLRFASVSELATVDYTQIVWGIVISYVVWDQIPPATTWVGAAIIIVCSLAVMRIKRA